MAKKVRFLGKKGNLFYLAVFLVVFREVYLSWQIK